MGSQDSTDDAPTPAPDPQPGPQSARPRRSPRRAVALAVVTALTAGALALAAGTLTRSVTGPPPPAAVPAGLVGNAIPAGAAGAPVTVDVYAEFGCPGCNAALADASGPLAAATNTGAVALRYHLTAGTTQAAQAANAAACLAGTGGPAAADYYLLLLGGPEQHVDAASLIQDASRLSYDTPAFDRCVREGTYLPWLKTQSRARHLPAFFVNGAPVTAGNLAARLHAVGVAVSD